MRAAIDRNNAEEAAVHIVVEKDDLARRLDNLVGRTDAWYAWRVTLQDRVGLNLTIAQIFDFGQILRLVLRKTRLRRWRWRFSATAAARTWWRTVEDTHRAVGKLLRVQETEAAFEAPRPVEIRSAIRQPRYRLSCPDPGLRLARRLGDRSLRSRHGHREEKAGFQETTFHGALVFQCTLSPVESDGRR